MPRSTAEGVLRLDLGWAHDRRPETEAVDPIDELQPFDGPWSGAGR